MKFAASNIGWKKESDLYMYRLLRDNGFTGLEIAPTRIVQENPYDHIDDAIKIKKRLFETYGLSICSMQSIWYGKNERIFGSSEERIELLNYTKKAIEFASAIECENLVFGCPRNRIIGGQQDKEIALEFFSKIGEMAEENYVTLAIEANPVIYNTNFLNTTKETIHFVREVAKKAVKVNLDMGTVIQNDEGLDCIGGNIELVNHVHISEPHLLPIEYKEIHRELLRLMIEKEYDKYVSIEMKSTENREDIELAISRLKEIHFA